MHSPVVRSFAYMFVGVGLLLGACGGSKDKGSSEPVSSSAAKAKTKPKRVPPKSSATPSSSAYNRNEIPDNISANQTLKDFAKAYCARWAACFPADDPKHCEERTIVRAKASLRSPGNTNKMDGLKQCGDAKLASMSCGELAINDSRPLLNTCFTLPGKTEEGKACMVNAQCSSTYCAHAPGAGCGTCKTPLKEGADCKDHESCGIDQVCDAGKCAKAKKVGDACKDSKDGAKDADVFCQYADATCVKGKCAAKAKSGEACDAAGKEAAKCALGLVCDATTKKCAAPAKKETEACSETAPCERGLYCDSTSKQCAKRKDYKAECSKDEECLSGTRCLRNKCEYKMPDAASCQ